MVLLQVENLTTYFFMRRGTVKAVDGISFTVEEGEAVGIVGESGSGKSVTALSILRLVSSPGRIVGGRVLLRGRNLLECSDDEMRQVRRREIAMIFQDPVSCLNPIMTVGSQIAETIEDRFTAPAALHQRVIDGLRATHLADPARAAQSYPHQLSGGMQQRAVITASMVREPSLIIADEPTTALDATVQLQILRLLNELRAATKAAVILITHDLAVVAHVCNRVYVMYAGQIVESGPTEQILREPRHPYTQALLGAVLDPWEDKAKLVVLEGEPPNMMAPPVGCRFHPRCPAVMQICRDAEPPELTLGDGQTAKCWLYRS